MKKTLKAILLGLVISCACVFNVDAKTIKEETKDYAEPMFILGSTRFEASEVLSADAVLIAGFNHAKVLAMLGEDITEVDLLPKAYYYNPDFNEWFKIEGSDTTPLEEDEIEEIEEKLEIYFVNNEVKKIEIEYSGDVDEILTEGVTYDGEKFTVSALTPTVDFKANGESVKVTVNEDVIDENAVIKVNGVYFTEANISEAILASSPEHPAVLLKDVELSEAIVLDKENTNMVLDLGGNILSSDTTKNPKRVLTTSGANSVLTIKNGDIVAEGAQLIAVGKKELESERVTLNIENDVTITGYWYGVFTIGDTAVLNLKGTINVTEDGYAIAGNGTKNVGYDGTEINILEGAVINAEKGHALYLAQAGTANISGGTLTADTVIGIKSGKLNITGGTLAATGAQNPPAKNNNGINTTGDVIYAEVNDSYAKNIEINITGGTLTSENGNIIQEFKSASTDNIKVTGLYTTKNVIDSTLATYIKTNEALLIANGVTYAGLQGAVIDVEDGSTIKLLANVDLPTAVEIAKKVTIDLNGHNLTVTKDTAGYGVFYVIEGGDLTIDGEGIVDGVGENEWNIAIWADGGNVTINDGTYTNVGAGEDDHYDLIYAKNGGKVVINGGRFEAQTPKWTLNLKDKDGSSITVQGGTFVQYNPAEVYTEPTQPLNFVAEGYKVVKENNEYTVVEAKDEIVVTGNSLQDAIDNADDGAVINITKDMDLPTAVEIAKTVTINLNGHNLTISEDTEGYGVFYVIEGGDLTINGEGIVDGVGKNEWNIAIWADGGNVTINGGTYTNVGAGEDDHYDLIYAKNGGTVVINGGRFEAQTPKWTLNLKDKDGSSITVQGGTFVQYNPAEVYTEPTQPLNFVAEGYEVVESAGEYTVIEIG